LPPNLATDLLILTATASTDWTVGLAAWFYDKFADWTYTLVGQWDNV
jgi:hypothetical protein